jgi:hypothetical protein
MARKLSKTFKITSRFYVIYGDYEPIYVGYTNRTVRQRFREHKEDKDFSEYENVEVKELADEKLSFNFTWDYERTCKNADEVSLREGQLVQKYNTQDSVFQKADGGGQTWATEKWFVKSNKDNPRFTGMSGAEIKACLKEEKVVSVWLGNFVSTMRPVEEVWLGSFVSNMRPVEERWLSDFVNDMRPVEKVWIGNFVNHMTPAEEVWLHNFINNMRPAEEVWLSSFIGSMIPAEEVWLHNFVNRMRPAEEVWLGNFVNHMTPAEEVWLGNFVSTMRPVEERWLSDFVNHMKYKRR